MSQAQNEARNPGMKRHEYHRASKAGTTYEEKLDRARELIALHPEWSNSKVANYIKGMSNATVKMIRMTPPTRNQDGINSETTYLQSRVSLERLRDENSRSLVPLKSISEIQPYGGDACTRKVGNAYCAGWRPAPKRPYCPACREALRNHHATRNGMYL